MFFESLSISWPLFLDYVFALTTLDYCPYFIKLLSANGFQSIWSSLQLDSHLWLIVLKTFRLLQWVADKKVENWEPGKRVEHFLSLFFIDANCPLVFAQQVWGLIPEVAAGKGAWYWCRPCDTGAVQHLTSEGYSRMGLVPLSGVIRRVGPASKGPLVSEIEWFFWWTCKEVLILRILSN